MDGSPIFPIITIADRHTVKIVRDKTPMASFRLSDLEYQTSEQYAFDSSGFKWKFKRSAPNVKNSIWNQLRNPTVDGIVVWEPLNNYTLSELKFVLEECVDKDEAMTEHESGEFLKSAIKNTKSLGEILATLDKYIFNVNESELWREQENR